MAEIRLLLNLENTKVFYMVVHKLNNSQKLQQLKLPHRQHKPQETLFKVIHNPTISVLKFLLCKAMMSLLVYLGKENTHLNLTTQNIRYKQVFMVINNKNLELHQKLMLMQHTNKQLILLIMLQHQLKQFQNQCQLIRRIISNFRH